MLHLIIHSKINKTIKTTTIKLFKPDKNHILKYMYQRHTHTHKYTHKHNRNACHRNTQLKMDEIAPTNTLNRNENMILPILNVTYNAKTDSYLANEQDL